jgi:hypothetical protein
MIYFCIVKKTLFILTFFILFKPLFPIVEYVVNYEYISKVLCVNKETPIMGCDGKCYLMSQLAKSTEDEKPISDKKVIVKAVELLFFQEIFQIVFTKITTNTEPILNTNYSNLYTYLNSCSVFHPPSLIS